MSYTIEIATEAGACYGVERALKMAHELAAKKLRGTVATLGPLIHNPQVVKELADEGMGSIKELDQSKGAALLLRTHGVTPAEEREAQERFDEVVDATCPFVKNVHASVERLEREGYTVFVVGEQGHPEVKATVAHVQKAYVVNSKEEIEALDFLDKQSSRVGVVVQTTMAAARLSEVVGALAPRVRELRLMNTICEATSGHQKACAELAQHAHIMIIVGGKMSANTTHLAEIAREICPATYHIESADELEPAWFEAAAAGPKTLNIGISAGASTPASHIEAVRVRIDEIMQSIEASRG